MSDRLMAPARAPVRRVGGGFDVRQEQRISSATSPVRPVEANTSPVRRKQSPTPQPSVEIVVPEIDYGSVHLAPALQRFWQKAQAGLLSPRSMRFTEYLPKPKDASEATLVKLSHIRDEIVDVMENARKIQEMIGLNLKRHFEMIPQEKLTEAIRERFRAFDIDGSGYLETHELKDAFASMGKQLTVDQINLIIKEYDVDGNGQFDIDEFEDMVRCTLNLHKHVDTQG